MVEASHLSSHLYGESIATNCYCPNTRIRWLIFSLCLCSVESASQGTFMTDSLAKHLGLKQEHKELLSITTFGVERL